MTGINILSLSERQVPGGGSAGADVKLNTQVDTSRTITVEFDANARGPWEFKPAQRSMQVHPGQLATVMYEFQNVQDRRMAAQAIPSYAPHQAAAAFQQARVLLLQPVHAGAGREEAVAGGVRDRPEAVQGRDHDHAVLHLLRGGRQDAAGAAWPTSDARPPEREGPLVSAQHTQ